MTLTTDVAIEVCGASVSVQRQIPCGARMCWVRMVWSERDTVRSSVTACKNGAGSASVAVRLLSV